MTEWLSDRFNPGPFFTVCCFVALGLIPLVWLGATARRRRPAIRFSSLDSMRSLPLGLAQRTRFLLPLMRSLAIVALIVALARPQSGGEYRSSREGIAIQMVLDVSGSMQEPDFVIDGTRVRRLDAVKKVFKDFVLGRGSLGGRESDLVGMTTFAMFADTPCPLTLDHASLSDLLDETEIPGWVDGRQIYEDPEAGNTALGDAITLAADDLRRAGEQAVAGIPGAEAAKSRVMILLTDGENNPAKLPGTQPPDPMEAAQVAANLGIKIYTIGAVGGVPRQRRPFAMLRGRGVDEGSLKQIASITGGKYFRATDTDSLVTIYDEIDRLERRSTGERAFEDNIYAARTAMLIGLALVMTELFLANTRYRRLP